MTKIYAELFKNVVGIKEEVKTLGSGKFGITKLEGTTLIFELGNTLFLEGVSLNKIIKALPENSNVSILSEPLNWGSDE